MGLEKPTFYAEMRFVKLGGKLNPNSIPSNDPKRNESKYMRKKTKN